jgi:hypothetical protein
MERRIGQNDHRLKGADRNCNLRNGFVDLFQMITISIDRGIDRLLHKCGLMRMIFGRNPQRGRLGECKLWNGHTKGPDLLH